MQQIAMDNRHLETQFSLGPLRFQGADCLELSELYCSIDEASITLRLSADYPPESVWRGTAMLVFFAFRLPNGTEAFEETVQRYQADAKGKVRLPEKCHPDQTTLSPSADTNDWNHDCFATGSRNLFHVFRSESTGLMIRLFAQRGTMLDHPLLSFVPTGVTLEDNLWVADEPTTQQRTSPPPGVPNEAPAEESEPRRLLDLREDVATIREFIQQRIQSFDPSTNFGPGEGGAAISILTLGFYAQQGGWLALIFDCRPDAELDGEWTRFLDDGNLLELDGWVETYEAVCEHEDVTIIDSNGETHAISDNNISDEDLNQLFGETIQQVIKELQATDWLATLPQSTNFRIEIEEFDGYYNWPK